MLERLEVRDVVTIEALALDFGAGLTALTGETGAGKSILLDALGFALGFADARGLVRAGAAEGEAVAVLSPPAGHAAWGALSEAGLGAGAEELILRRVAAAAGPSRAYVNDRRVSAETLRALGETLLEIHGQHDERGLMNPRGHRAILDAFAGAEPERDAARAAWTEARRALAALAEAEASLAAAERERELLAHEAEELRGIAPKAGEEAALDARLRLMKSAAGLRERLSEARALLSGESGAETQAARAARLIERAAAQAEELLGPPLAALGRAWEALAEAGQGLEAAEDALGFDEREMEAASARLLDLRALARKHRCAPDDLPAVLAEREAALARIEAGAEGIAGLARAAKAAEAAYGAAADALSAKRREAAARLDAAVAGELPSLKMERARFATEIREAPAGPEGRDEIAFLVAANPGAPPGPLARVASGGELSRLLLAFKVALAARSAPAAMIFDEIDRGVGGATADAVGRRLARLAQGAQVLVVTHSPQVAAWADAQLLVEKRVEGGATRTLVRALSPSEREAEIARMLAGGEVTAEARAAAAALIEAARKGA